MFPRIISARHCSDYNVEVKFSDGTRAEFDFADRIFGRRGVFTALEDVDFFSRLAVDAEAGTLVWPNGVDFCPDVLYAEAVGKSVDEVFADVEKR